MGRIIAAVIAGYVVMALIVFVGLTIAYTSMGPERAFQPGSFQVTGLWLIVMFAVSLVAAAAGGFCCAAISPNPKAPLALVGVVLVLGLLSAIPAVLPSDQVSPETRTGDTGNLEAMQQAKQPVWVALSMPVIGAIGALAGARFKRGPQAAAPA